MALYPRDLMMMMFNTDDQHVLRVLHVLEKHYCCNVIGIIFGSPCTGWTRQNMLQAS